MMQAIEAGPMQGSSGGERPWTFCHIKWKGSLGCTCWVCGHQLPCGVISKGSLGWTHSVPIEPQIVFAEAVTFFFLVLLDTSYWLFSHLP